MNWDKGRALTVGEYRLLQPIFRHALDYGRVRVMGRRYLPFQAALVAMSPNGNMFFPYHSLYCTDFSCVSLSKMALFVHEAVHVWQHQMGFSVRLCGLCIALQGGYQASRAYEYRHLLGKYTHLSQFNMEQQAVIIAEFFSAKWLNQAVDERLTLLMQPFLDNPADKALLPQKNGFSGCLKEFVKLSA
ncbi:type IV secretion protein Rhs [Neisseriaceae bacterium B1]